MWDLDYAAAYLYFVCWEISSLLSRIVTFQLFRQPVQNILNSIVVVVVFKEKQQKKLPLVLIVTTDVDISTYWQGECFL